jgi:thiol-disulfide isomerase/thioredoxin/cbb3-type cytochrome oxidase subunit 3
MKRKNFQKKGMFVIGGVLFLLLIISLAINVNAQENSSGENLNEVSVHFFWGDGCPHCETQKTYLEEWKEKYGENIQINSYETWKNSENAALFREFAKDYGIEAKGVPTTFIEEKYWIGFSPSMAPEMEAYIKSCVENECGKIEQTPQENNLCIHVFLDNCAECLSIENYLEEIDEKYNIEIKKYNINEGENKHIFQEFKNTYGLKVNLYPTLFIGNVYLTGEEPIRKALEKEINNCLDEGCPCPISEIKPFTPITAKPEDVTSDEKQSINFFGKEIDVGKMPLIFSTFIISFIDGFNPCSLWVITFLLGIVILTGSRKKVLAIGFTYLIVAGIAYGAFILGMISIFSYIGYLTWIRILVASIAIIFALVNIKDFFWYKKGLSFTIPDSYKPKIFKKIRNIMKPENKLTTLIIGSAIMALGITLVELPCTAGFPMLWSNIIASHSINLGFFIFLFALYMVTYFLIELVIFFSVVFTLRTSRFEQKHGRLLKLIGGVIMFALAIVLIFNHELLNNITSTVLIFVGAIALSILIAWIYNKKNKLEVNEKNLNLNEKKEIKNDSEEKNERNINKKNIKRETISKTKDKKDE